MMHNAFMTPMAERLKQARELAGYETAADAAAALNVPYGTYSCHENGSRGYGRQVGRYAKFFKVNLVWLLTGQGQPKNAGQSIGAVQQLFDELPEQVQLEAIDYLEFLRTRRR